jgi:hypothetical protein
MMDLEASNSGTRMGMYCLLAVHKTFRQPDSRTKRGIDGDNFDQAAGYFLRSTVSC